MTIAPGRLNRIAPHIRDAQQSGALGRQRLIRVFVNVAQDIGFALAPGARATTTQRLQWHKALRAIVPFDGQFLANLLNIDRSHTEILTDSNAERPLIFTRLSDSKVEGKPLPYEQDERTTAPKDNGHG